MTKSYELYILGLYQAIITDCEIRYPHLRKDFGRDSSRLLSCLNTRGLSFFTIDLVDFGKHFDICLSTQRLTPSSLPFQRGYKKGTVIPRLFKGLLLRVFDQHGMLRHDCDSTSIQFLRQLYYTAKKIRLECTDERSEKVIRSFTAIERDIRRGSHNWDLDEPSWDYLDTVHLGQDLGSPEDHRLPLFEEEVGDVSSSTDSRFDVIQVVSDIVSTTMGRFDPYAWKAKHGPGAVSDARKGESKYSFPHWPKKLERTFPIADFGFTNFGAWGRYVSTRVDSGDYLHEPPSNLILVPKTLKAPRLIASEPVSHQWCQQIIKDYFVGRVSSTWISGFINFKDQIPNQLMALQGSLDGSLSTIDLSEASDRVSTWLVERIFRRSKSLVDALQASRTRSIVNRTEHGIQGASKLRKFSCMGSACTFPVQTIVFLCIAIGTVLHMENRPATIKNIRSLKGKVRTFGDDIIVPNEHAEEVMKSLTLLGLKVNHSKTFFSGSFRESCGLDVYKGTNVTPVYTMTIPSRPKPESISSVVETHNNFVKRGWYSVASYLETTVRKEVNELAYVAIGSGDFGLQTPYVPDNTHLKRRYNKDLQRLEWQRVFVQTKASRTPDEVDSMVLQYFTEDPSPDDIWKGGVPSRPSLYLKRGWEELR